MSFIHATLSVDFAITSSSAVGDLVLRNLAGYATQIIITKHLHAVNFNSLRHPLFRIRRDI